MPGASKYSLPFFLLTLVLQVLSKPTLNPPSLLHSLQTKQISKVNILLSFTQARPVTQIFDTSRHLFSTFENRADRLNFVAHTLQNETKTVQKDLSLFLQKEKSTGMKVTQLWISNQIIVKGADLTLVQKLSEREDLSLIEQEILITLDPTIQENISGSVGRDNEINANEWGVIKIGAPTVWSTHTKGEEIVVANIDTGVRATHETLKSNHRTPYGWFDAVNGDTTPFDDQGHGTHTIGTIAGQNGIGVAPGAKWISCKGCYKECDEETGECGGWCSNLDTRACAQWTLCPTDPAGFNEDCSQAPDVVSMSYGGGGVSHTEEIAAWMAAGIIPVASLGNSGPNCGTSGSPGNQEGVIGVGATNSSDIITSFSSRGPAGSRTKPDVVAPGYAVRSASYNDDTSLVSMHGTSMACPHVSGLVALMLSKFRKENVRLDFYQVKDLLQRGAVQIRSPDSTCGGIPSTIFPNNVVGYGRVDAMNSMNKNPIPPMTTTTTPMTTTTTPMTTTTTPRTTTAGSSGISSVPFFLLTAIVFSILKNIL